MPNLGFERLAAAMPQQAITATAATPAREQHPPGIVRLDNSGTKNAMKYSGLAGAVAGTALTLGAGVAAIRGGRVNLLPMLLGGGVGLGGAGLLLAGNKLGPKLQAAVATKIETREQAQEIAGSMNGRRTRVERDVVDGTFAVVDLGAAQTPGRSGGTRGRTYDPGYRDPYPRDPYMHDPYYRDPYLPPRHDPFYPIPDYGRGNAPGDSGFGQSPGWGGIGNGTGDSGGWDPGSGSGGYPGPGDSGGSVTPPPAYNPPSTGGNSTDNGSAGFDDL